MTALLHGLLIGLSFVIFIGPVFFTLLKKTLQSGFWAGFYVALGIIIGDIICVVICSFGAIPFFKNPNNQFWLGVVGSIILLIMGLKFLIRPGESPADDEPVKKLTKGNYAAYFSQGFVVNFVNPFVFIVWIGIIGYAETEYGYTPSMFIFLAASLVAIFFTDLTKVYFAQKIKKFLTPVFLKRLYRVFGIALIIFGIRLVFFVLN